jgi:starch phosphorylase
VLTPLRDNLLYHDPFLCLADFESYCKAQEKVSKAFMDKPSWGKMAVLNTARVGKFSSDRTIAEYAKDIWKLKPVKVS